MIIRSEQPGDIEEIRRINIEAFGSESEADLVKALRDSDIPLISLVAKKDDEPVGHILFSPVSIEPENANIRITGLAPMAVVFGVPIRDVQAWMGHSDIQSTMIYTHHAPDVNSDKINLLPY